MVYGLVFSVGECERKWKVDNMVRLVLLHRARNFIIFSPFDFSLSSLTSFLLRSPCYSSWEHVSIGACWTELKWSRNENVTSISILDTRNYSNNAWDIYSACVFPENEEDLYIILSTCRTTRHLPILDQRGYYLGKIQT